VKKKTEENTYAAFIGEAKAYFRLLAAKKSDKTGFKFTIVGSYIS